MMNNETATALWISSHVFALVLARVAEKLAVGEPQPEISVETVRSIAKDARLGYSMIESVFELASEFRLGDYVEPSQVDDLIREDGLDEPYFVIGLERTTVETMEASRLVSSGFVSHVGVLVFRVAKPLWVFWCPVGYPLSDRRLLILPRPSKYGPIVNPGP